MQEKVFEPVLYEIDKDKASHNITITVKDPGEGLIYIQLPIQEMTVNVHNSAGEKEIRYSTAQEIYRVGTPDSEGILSIELSADAPLREPYIAYFQGGLSYWHSRFGVIKSVDALYKKGLITL